MFSLSAGRALAIPARTVRMVNKLVYILTLTRFSDERKYQRSKTVMKAREAYFVMMVMRLNAL